MFLFYYILKVIIISAVLFGYYVLALKDKKFHQYNRFYLLLTVAASALLPLVKINFWEAPEVQAAPDFEMMRVIELSDRYVETAYSKPGIESFITSENILLAAGFLVSTILLIKLLSSLYKVYSLSKNNPFQSMGMFKIFFTIDPSTPFSFFRSIYWNNRIPLKSEAGERILKHEIAHIEEKHTHDKIFINVALILFWLNPVFWLIKRELSMIHEFIADKKAVEDGDTESFAAMILASTFPHQFIQITNPFFLSPIKRRLTMITKNKSKAGYIGRVIALPVMVALAALFTFKTKEALAENPPTLNSNESITVVIDPGHGGSDNGAVAANGSFEKDLTLDLAKAIKSLSNGTNIKVILTRESDVTLGPKAASEFANSQKADLFIALHADAIDNNGKRGAAVFIANSDHQFTDLNSKFANSVISSLEKHVSIPVNNAIQQRENSIWVLKNSKVPAVVIEAGFMTNKDDLAYLQSAEGKNKFSLAVLEAIKQFNAYSAASAKADATTALPVSQFSDTPKMTIMNMNIKGDKHDLKGLFILDGKEYSWEQVKGKTIKAREAHFYDANNPELIRLYGKKKAAKAIIIATGVTIESNGTDEFNFSSDNVISHILRKPNIETPKVYAVNGKIISEDDLKSIQLADFDSIKILKGEEAIQKYGKAGQNGVVELNIKQNKQHNKPSDNENPTDTVKPLKGTSMLATAELIAYGDNDMLLEKPGQEITHNDIEFYVIDGIEYNNKKEAQNKLSEIIKGNSSGGTVNMTYKTLPPANAILKFGQKAKNGAIEITISDPVVMFGGTTKSRVSMKDIDLNNAFSLDRSDYRILSAKVYFSGENFKETKSVEISSTSLSKLKPLLSQITKGSFVTIENVKVVNETGNVIPLTSRSFAIYE